jgi:hypothetical protein
MKRSSLILAVSLGLGVALSAQARDDSAAQAIHRDARQQERVAQGLASGELSRQEVARIELMQQRISAIEADALASGGGLRPHEADRIQREQNQIGQMIRRDKHDRDLNDADRRSTQRLQRIVERSANEQRRIAQGVTSGELSTREAARLEQGQAHLAGALARAAQDGRVSADEHNRLQRIAGNQGHRVARNKHDADRDY